MRLIIHRPKDKPTQDAKASVEPVTQEAKASPALDKSVSEDMGKKDPENAKAAIDKNTKKTIDVEEKKFDARKTNPVSKAKSSKAKK